MSRMTFLLAMGSGVFVLAAPSLAHHSFLATYFDDRTQEIEGTVIQFLLRNPEDHRMRLVTLSRPSDGLTWGTRQGEVVD